MKAIDGIDMEKVKAGELKEMIIAFNGAKLGIQIKPGVNPLGSAKAFVKAVEELDEDTQEKLPAVVKGYYNAIVVSDEELNRVNAEKVPAVAAVAEAELPKAGPKKSAAAKGNKTEQKKPAVVKKEESAKKSKPKNLSKTTTPDSGRTKMRDSMTISIVKEKEPKKPGTNVFELFELVKKCKTVGAFVKAGGDKKALSFYRYHGKLVVE